MKIKICGLRRPEDIAFVNQALPDYAGFILGFPKSRRNISPEQLRFLTAELDPRIQAVGVFVDADIELPLQLLSEKIIQIVQLHGTEDAAYIGRIRERLPEAIIWQAFQIQGSEDVKRAAASSADLILVDAGQGGGRTFDWSLLKALERPYILAGGLDPRRIETAAGLTGIAGVDLSSGVETEGVKDAEKIRAAVAAARLEK